jgi:putative hydrolase of the HAD superfamily
VRCVFFDVDFTLIYPGSTFQGEGYQRFCTAYGIEVDVAGFDAAVKAASFILDDVVEPLYDHALFIHYTATIIEHMGGRGPHVVSAARDIYEQWAANHHFELYDDVAPTLRALVDRGFIIGLISNTHRSLDRFREHFALDGLIHAAVSSYEHGYLKPHRSIFDEALARAGVSAEQAIMVGDSLRADIQGALAAGMRALLLRRSGDTPAGLPEGVPVIRSLTEIEGYV